MEIKLSPDKKKLLVIKSIEDEIASLEDGKLKEKLSNFKKDFDKYIEEQEKVNKTLTPMEESLGKQLNEINNQGKQKKN